MRNLDIFIVRVVPYIMFVIFGVYLLLSWAGIDVSVLYHLHSNSALYALSLYLISLSNKKYHCKWNRAMYLFLIVVPVFNFTDAIFDYVPSNICYLSILSLAFGTTAVWTLCKSIQHYIHRNKKTWNQKTPIKQSLITKL